MKYEKINFPDGQISVKLLDQWPYGHVEMRINSYEDLMTLLSLTEVIKNNGHRPTKLTLPCLFGQRSDRRFEPNRSFDLLVIANLINQCGFEQVEIFDPHSDVACALVKNSHKLSSFKWVQIVANEREDRKNLVLVSPDAGAYKKVFEYAQELQLPVVAGVKHRDNSGKIDLKFIGDVIGKDCLIVDDLADGGYTFIVLAKMLREEGARRVTLYVSHAYFNKGVDTVLESIDHIYCTNSIKEISHEKVTQFKII